MEENFKNVIFIYTDLPYFPHLSLNQIYKKNLDNPEISEIFLMLQSLCAFHKGLVSLEQERGDWKYQASSGRH